MDHATIGPMFDGQFEVWNPATIESTKMQIYFRLLIIADMIDVHVLMSAVYCVNNDIEFFRKYLTCKYKE